MVCSTTNKLFVGREWRVELLEIKVAVVALLLGKLLFAAWRRQTDFQSPYRVSPRFVFLHETVSRSFGVKAINLRWRYFSLYELSGNNKKSKHKPLAFSYLSRWRASWRSGSEKAGKRGSHVKHFLFKLLWQGTNIVQELIDCLTNWRPKDT